MGFAGQLTVGGQFADYLVYRMSAVHAAAAADDLSGDVG
jgi:hypothetical protein